MHVYTCTISHLLACIGVHVMCIHVQCLTVPSVVNFTTGLVCGLSEGEACNSLWTTLAAAFCSTCVGGNGSGRDSNCPTVSLDGE